VFYDVVDNVIAIVDGQTKGLNWVDDYNSQLISLDMIRDQLDDGANAILVIHERPIGGSVYRWGNHDREHWWQVGTMDGYA